MDGINLKTIKVVYVGNDDVYWGTLSKRFVSTYDFKEFDIQQIPFHEPDEMKSVILKILDYDFHIIYIDISNLTPHSLMMGKILSNEYLSRKSSVLGIKDYLADKSLAQKALFHDFVSLHVKSGEVHDVCYDAMNITFPDIAKHPDFAKAQMEGDKLHMYSHFKITQIKAKNIRIEGDIDLLYDEFKDEEDSDDMGVLSDNDEVPIYVKTFLNKDIFPSERYNIKKKLEKTNSFNAKYSYDLSYLLVDPFDEDKFESDFENKNKSSSEENSTLSFDVKEEEDAESEKASQESDSDQDNPDEDNPEKNEEDDGVPKFDPIEEKKKKLQKLRAKKKFLKDRMDDLKKAKGRLKDFLNRNAKTKNTLKSKVLIIDKEFSLFSENITEKMNKTQYVPFFQSCLSENMNFLVQLLPKIIFFQQEKELPESRRKKTTDEDEIQSLRVLRKNKEESLQDLIVNIKRIKNYTPFLIVTQARGSTKVYQDNYQYKQIIAHPEALNLEMINSMVTLLDQKAVATRNKKYEKALEDLRMKDPSHFETVTVQDLIPAKVFPSPAHPEQFRAKVRFDIELISISESCVWFRVPFQLPMHSVFEVEEPVYMLITVVPHIERSPEAKLKNTYRGLIHAIGEDNKKSVRRFVNSVFFRQVEATKAKEKEMYDNRLKMALKVKMKDENEKKKEMSMKEIEEKMKREAEEQAKREKEEEQRKEALSANIEQEQKEFFTDELAHMGIQVPDDQNAISTDDQEEESDDGLMTSIDDLDIDEKDKE